ncbi:hypothetical protein Psyc_0473 [Psychrobacter arcticus 273-4]|uniref:Uncharacterized protein n=1 Tax=Psychrobacter arcticus (strain DSM 17307 / VKM B-2377 / 273-4) TaxID=259536 RepID=Q4FUH2_PSYA2|nr:hypothetical protein [Psychrobacter arcticus]AAZ18336.1 hypothetical protein Psyc_0473 [Psychrobacter arcticus 273-4]
MSDKYKPERDIDTVTVTSVKGDNNHKVQTPRAQYENNRLQNILAERNQQLQTVEQQLTNTQLSYKHACKNTRMLMALCVLLIVVMSLGGEQ